MKHTFCLLALLLPAAAQAQTARDLTEISMDLYQQANSPEALRKLNDEIATAPESFVVAAYQPGTLYLVDQKQQAVPGLRYNVALRLLEVRDDAGFHAWPVGSLRGFDQGQGAQVRRFRTWPVRGGATGGGTVRDFVEVLTATEAPLLLAVQHYFINEPAEIDPVLRTVKRPARRAVGVQVLAGSGGNPNEPLRSLNLNEKPVLKLFGTRSIEMERYAKENGLRFDQLGDVLKLVEHYNATTAKLATQEKQ